MKKLLLILLPVIFLSGCLIGGPGKVVINWFKAINSDTPTKAMAYMTPGAAKASKRHIENGNLLKAINKVALVDLQETPLGEVTRVTVKLTFCTVQHDGRWKVCHWK